jgi:hypothetical protein
MAKGSVGSAEDSTMGGNINGLIGQIPKVINFWIKESAYKIKDIVVIKENS